MNTKPARKAIITHGAGPDALGALSPKQHQAVIALLEERTKAAAAERAGCTPRTLNGWLRDPTFQAALAEARRETLRATLSRLQVAAGEALEVLREVLKDPNVFARLQASQTILGHALRVAQAEELERRLEALEAQLARRAGSPLDKFN